MDWRNGRDSNPRPPAWQAGILTSWTTTPQNVVIGSDLLSHGEAPHYHRRYSISLLSSAWDQVELLHYCCQKNLFLKLTRWISLRNKRPGGDLLSHGDAPHYHRRYGVSLLSSAWGQVGPPHYRRQDYSFDDFIFTSLFSSFFKFRNKLLWLISFSVYFS